MSEEIVISHFSLKGKGVGFLDNGAKVEVDGAVPGDRLLVDLGCKRRKAYRGRLLTIVETSPLRVSARCRHVPLCGGCCWQELDYKAQLQEKEQRIVKAFSHFSAPIRPILPCDEPFHYRNKMEFSFSQDRAGNQYLGLVLTGTKGKVFNVTDCKLVEPWVNQLLAAVRTWWQKSGLSAYHPHRDEGSLRTLIVREGKRTKEKLILLTVSGNPRFALAQQQIAHFVAAVQKALATEIALLSIFLRIQQQIKGSPTQFFEVHLTGPDHIHERLNLSGRDFLFKISPTSFFQPNTVQAEKLYTAALQMVAPGSKKLIFDLYCGTATLGMLFASQAEKVLGIELNPYALFDAESNRELNQITNLELIQGDVGEKLLELPSDPDLIVVDPPRAGLSEQALQRIISKNPYEILYISCNPSTQAENIEHLHRGGYQLLEVQPVDQFPHTPHIENIVLLRRAAR
jgi:23S rRNA (uracil1939-C5)-methyltransferase